MLMRKFCFNQLEQIYFFALKTIDGKGGDFSKYVHLCNYILSELKPVSLKIIHLMFKLSKRLLHQQSYYKIKCGQRKNKCVWLVYQPPRVFKNKKTNSKNTMIFLFN